MTIFWFPDNTVFCNFASVDKVGLLEAILSRRGRWTEAVELEVRASARVKHRSLDPLAMRRWLGEPITTTSDGEAYEVETIRTAVFGGTASAPRQHLGEAQTMFVIQTRPEFKSATWISDDKASLAYARRKGITALDTAGLMGVGCVAGDVDHLEAFRL